MRRVLIDSEASFRWNVVPLGLFFTFGGVVFPILAWVVQVPITSSAPFIRSEDTNRNLLGAIGILCSLIGIGLLRRWRIGWYALLAYLGFGSLILPVIGSFDAEFLERTGSDGLIFSGAINLAISIGIYFVTRSAFERKPPGTPPHEKPDRCRDPATRGE